MMYTICAVVSLQLSYDLDITYNKEGTLQIIRLAITEEIANHNNREH